MFKIFFRIFLALIIIILLITLYLSIFGIKTNKFNELIKSQIVKQDDRLDIDLKDVYIKLNTKERSFSLNSQDVKFFINKNSQKIANVDILIGLESIIRQNNKIKKIIINSKENEINNLLKFIRAYKTNIPALYLENSITEGKIIYDITINFKDNNFNQIEIDGKIIDTELNILGKEKLENINFNFNYKDQNLEIINLNLKYKNIDFVSKKISVNINKDFVDIKGEFENKINLNLISNLLDYDLKKFFDEKILLSSKSDFNISFNKKFKIKNYNLNCKLDWDDIKVNLKNTNLNNYMPDFEDKIILKNGGLTFKISSQNIFSINMFSKYIFNEKQKLKDISISYSKENSNENYILNIDLFENLINFKQIDFIKEKNKEMFLNLDVKKNKNNYEIKDFRMFNDKNIFSFKNVKLNKNFKIEDFNLIKAEFHNKDDFFNEILIKKTNNNIKLNSKAFDISKNVEESLKSSYKINLLDIFQNLNSSVDINIKLAKLDNDHDLKNIKGKILLKKNKVYKANLSANFDESNNFNYSKIEMNGKKITTIFSDVTKPFVKKFKFIKGFEGGKLDYTSIEVNNDLTNSELRIYDFKLHDMPALTKLLSLASLQGIADLATGEGIRFNEFEMFFENSKDLMIINEIYALGPSISILMEGYIEKNNLVSLRGTLVPATTINKTISKIPLVGEILVGKKMGEGVFGVSFKIKGPPNDLETRVNPIKTLTPRFITRTLEKIKKNN